MASPTTRKEHNMDWFPDKDVRNHKGPICSIEADCSVGLNGGGYLQ